MKQKFLKLLTILCLFFFQTMSAQDCTQTGKIVASPLSPSAGFGGVVDISSNGVAVVGARMESPNGAAYIFENQGGVWTQVLKATGGFLGFDYGSRVAINETGTVIAVRSPALFSVFEKTGGSWAKTVDISLPGGITAVAVSNKDEIFVGVTGNSSTVPGAVYRYQKITGTWTQTAQLAPSDGASGFGLEVSVAPNGETLTVSNPAANAGSLLDVGSIYIFEDIAGTWTETALLMASDFAQFRRFGDQAAMSNDTVVVGDRNEDDFGAFSGAVYIFERVSGVWTETTKIYANSPKGNDFFGRYVDISVNNILIASNSPAQASEREVVSFSKNSAGVWKEVSKIDVSSFFAHSVAIAGGDVIIGDSSSTEGGFFFGAGTAYIFRCKLLVPPVVTITKTPLDTVISVNNEGGIDQLDLSSLVFEINGIDFTLALFESLGGTTQLTLSPPNDASVMIPFSFLGHSVKLKICNHTLLCGEDTNSN